MSLPQGNKIFNYLRAKLDGRMWKNQYQITGDIVVARKQRLYRNSYRSDKDYSAPFKQRRAAEKP
jgi:hypothetical protein